MMEFDQKRLGENLRMIRKSRNMTQNMEAQLIGVSEQAVSKWEKGECLPDVYNLKLLGQLLRVSIDQLLDMEGELQERVVETIRIGEAVFEILEKPETIFAGKVMYAKDYPDINTFYAKIEEVTGKEEQDIYSKVVDTVFPVSDVHMSVNFWLREESRAYGYVRETSNRQQPEGIDTYINPASLYIRAYTNQNTAMLITKKECELWELFAYIRDYFMPSHGFKMAENGAQELEVYDTPDHKTGYVYMPVLRN